MAVKIISKDERIPLVISGTTFYVRRPTEVEYREVLALATDRGETNPELAAAKMCDNFLVGWDDLQDFHGNQVAFDHAVFPVIPMAERMKIADGVRQLVEGTVSLEGKRVELTADDDPFGTFGTSSAQ